MVSKDPRRSGNPATRASAVPPSTPAGSRFERASRATLVRMSRMPPLVVPTVVLVLMLVGVSAPLPFAVPALAVAALFVLWLAYLSWSVIDTRGRLLRGVMLGLVIGAMAGRIFDVL